MQSKICLVTAGTLTQDGSPRISNGSWVKYKNGIKQQMPLLASRFWVYAMLVWKVLICSVDSLIDWISHERQVARGAGQDRQYIGKERGYYSLVRKFRLF